MSVLIPFLILAAPLIIAAAMLCGKKTRKPLLRYLSGAPLDGKYHTDATFFRHPTKVKHPRGRVVPHWWHWRPGWHRAAVRTGIPLLADLFLAGLLFATWLTLILLGAFLLGVLVRAGELVYRKGRRWWPSTSR
jgi:hypothetical protein